MLLLKPKRSRRAVKRRQRLTCAKPLTPMNGFGACTKCNCRNFEGNTYACANAGCGHAYQDHW